MTEQTNTPELRFPEFTEKLILQKLNSVASVTMGQSPKSSNYTDDSKQMTLVQGNADLKNGKINSRIYTTEITKIAKVQDIILTVRAPVGELAIAQKEVCIGRGVCAIKANKFVYYFLEKLKINKLWTRLSQGSTFEAISGNDIKNINVTLPSKKEQIKIGDFFSKLDQQIELEEKKLELLEQQKRGYIQKIFSQGLRFKDEEGNYYKEWDTKQLKDVLEFSNKRTTNENEYPVLTSSRQGLILQSDYYKDGKTFAESNIGYFILPKNYITYRSRSDDGIFKFNLNQIIDVGIISKYYPVFKGINTNQYYLTLHLNYQLKKEYIKYATGTSQLVLSKKNLQNIQTKLPSYEEQTKIANFLSELDKLIEKQSDKVELLKDRKKGLLQKMFV
ncbi:restriction endonuclease subunit S [Staphylococcus hominis]|uniref:restriction endonuclease subunit S n=1 Tax=Staphylococcus hominis TaxID=1290 RepID=UPI0011A64A1F|nr:restriction endonuclease subunit S [Staphylococcus hominis]